MVLVLVKFYNMYFFPHRFQLFSHQNKKEQSNMVLDKIQVTIIGVNPILSIVHWVYQRWHAPLKKTTTSNKATVTSAFWVEFGEGHTAAVRVCGGMHCSLKHWDVAHCTNNLNLLYIRSVLNYTVLCCLSSADEIPLVHWHWWCNLANEDIACNVNEIRQPDTAQQIHNLYYFPFWIFSFSDFPHYLIVYFFLCFSVQKCWNTDWFRCIEIKLSRLCSIGLWWIFCIVYLHILCISLSELREVELLKVLKVKHSSVTASDTDTIRLQ